MTRPSDPSVVGGLEQESLRRFLAARERGDAAAAAVAWEDVVVVVFDRVRSLVEVHGRRARLDEAERQEALSRALERICRSLRRTFRGTSMGELVNAIVTLVRNICTDVQREAMRRRRHEQPLDGGEDDTPTDVLLARAATADHERDVELRDLQRAVSAAIEAVADDRRRLVLRRTLDGHAAEEIAAELGVSMANLYQLRRRGILDLKMLLEGLDA